MALGQWKELRAAEEARAGGERPVRALKPRRMAPSYDKTLKAQSGLCCLCLISPHFLHPCQAPFCKKTQALLHVSGPSFWGQNPEK